MLRDMLDRAIAAGELPGSTDTDEAARAMHAYIEGVLLIFKIADDPRSPGSCFPSPCGSRHSARPSGPP